MEAYHLPLEELGKKTGTEGGGEEWSHVKWARGLKSKVRMVGDTVGEFVEAHVVRYCLPSLALTTQSD